LWEITETEENTPLQWLIQEVNPEEGPKKETTQSSEEGQIVMTKGEGEPHPLRHNSDSCPRTTYNQGSQREEMPMMKTVMRIYIPR
jgi:hypothetical protein